MTDWRPYGPTDEDFLHLWDTMQTDDILGYFVFARNVMDACRLGRFDGKRINSLMKQLPFEDINRFRQEVEVTAKSYEERDVLWGKEHGDISVDLFGIPVAGERASIEAMCETPDAGSLLTEAGYAANYFAAGSHCMVVPVPLSLEDLSQVGPQQLHELVMAMSTHLRNPEGDMTEIRGILAGMRSSDRQEMPYGRILDASVLLGAQLRFVTRSFGPGPDCLDYHMVSGHDEEKAEARSTWKRELAPFAAKHRVFAAPPVRWTSIRSTLADLMLTHAIFEAVTFGGGAAEGPDRNKVELSFAPQDDHIEVNVFYEDEYKMSMPFSLDLLPDCFDAFVRTLHGVYRVRPHDPNDNSRPRLQ